MRFLKQSTATTLLLGPFLDDTDGKTPETGLTIAQADVLLWKEGGTTLAQKNDATSCTHRSNGMYTCPVNTTDTNTLGVLEVSVTESGALPFTKSYMVVPAQVYDSLVAGTATAGIRADVRAVAGTTQTARDLGASVLISSGTGTGQLSVASGVIASNVAQINGSAANALNLNASASTIVRGTVDTSTFTATTTAFEAADITTAAADHFNGRLVIFTSGTLANQVGRINDYELVGGKGRFTVSTLTSAPANAVTFVIV